MASTKTKEGCKNTGLYWNFLENNCFKENKNTLYIQKKLGYWNFAQYTGKYTGLYWNFFEENQWPPCNFHGIPWQLCPKVCWSGSRTQKIRF